VFAAEAHCVGNQAAQGLAEEEFLLAVADQLVLAQGGGEVADCKNP
jgi:hypothetical protein